METALKFKFTQHDHTDAPRYGRRRARRGTFTSCHSTSVRFISRRVNLLQGFATELVLGSRRGRNGKQRAEQGADALARRASCVFILIPLRLARRFVWRLILKDGLLLLTGNDPGFEILPLGIIELKDTRAEEIVKHRVYTRRVVAVRRMLCVK